MKLGLLSLTILWHFKDQTINLENNHQRVFFLICSWTLSFHVFVCASLDPVSSGSYQWGSGWSDQSHPAAALGPSIQTQRNSALHFRGLIIKYSAHAFVRARLHASTCWSRALPPHQDYVAAMEDFQQSLELKKNQPIAMLYKGLTFFHRGMLKVSLVLLQKPVKNQTFQRWIGSTNTPVILFSFSTYLEGL